MSDIQINECVYTVHPIYDLYAADKNGEIIKIVKKKYLRKEKKQCNGYMKYVVRKYAQKSSIRLGMLQRSNPR